MVKGINIFKKYFSDFKQRLIWICQKEKRAVSMSMNAI